MPILSPTDRKTPTGRLVVAGIYLLLALGGLTMVYPFLITLTGSTAMPFDFERRSPLPRYMWSREDRFLRTLCTFFPPAHRVSLRQLRAYFPDLPPRWGTWSQMGDDTAASDTWARTQLDRLRDPRQKQQIEAAAADYGEFMRTWDLRETILAFDQRYVAPFLRARYGTLERLNAAWEISVDDFSKVTAPEWSGEPIDQPGYVPLVDTRYQDLLAFRQAYRDNRYTPYLAGPDAPAGYLRPASLRFLWEDYLAAHPAAPELRTERRGRGERREGTFGNSATSAPAAMAEVGEPGTERRRRGERRGGTSREEAAAPTAAMATGDSRTISKSSNSVSSALSASSALRSNAPETQFPVAADAPPGVRAVWLKFLTGGFPLRHVAIRVDDGRRGEFRRFLRARFRSLEYLGKLLERPVASWDAVRLTETIPDGPLAKVWMDFIRTSVPPEQWTIRETLPERAFQQFVLRKRGSLAAVNAAYGKQFAHIEELEIPFGPALLTTFANREAAFSLDQTTVNYRTVTDYLFQRGSAVRNTGILVALALLVALTVNPLAGYALSRFQLRQGEKILIFCLATMAFPAAVSAIPGFLLLRDMGLLNTFAALVLPGAANGMTIFLLKGFFDSLPKELYEAATIDGAPEWQIFLRISLPLVTPILAVSALNAFLAAYNGWEWALIVCQDPKVWTVAVWTYQFYQTTSSAPYTVLAAFIINSIPVLVVFLMCQKVILRGIILPQMK